MLFSGTLRSNLDPSGVHSEARLAAALAAAQLTAAVAAGGGLDASMAEAGDNLSVGQRQLFCLARCCAVLATTSNALRSLRDLKNCAPPPPLYTAAGCARVVGQQYMLAQGPRHCHCKACTLCACQQPPSQYGTQQGRACCGVAAARLTARRVP